MAAGDEESDDIMVRVKSEGRSKGCQACRKRKIKCDKVSPTCSYCARTGKQCSGASTGLVFLHANPEAGLSKTKRLLHERDEAIGSRNLARRPKTPDVVTGTELVSLEQNESPAHRTPSSPSSPTLGPQVDSPKANTIQFISGWISAHKDHELAFMVALQTLTAATFSTPASDTVEKVMLSITLAFDSVHSKNSDNKSLLMEAYKWYGFGLTVQRRQLEALARNPGQKPTLEQICMPVLLGYFEVTIASEHTAFINHWKAAMNLLEMAGPEAFQEDTLHRLFQIGRLQMMYLCLRMRKPYVFGEEIWRVVPFEGRARTMVNRAAEVFVQLPRLLYQADLRKAAGSDNRANFELEKKASLLIKRLDWINQGRKHVVKDNTAKSSQLEEMKETARIILLSEFPGLREEPDLNDHRELIDSCASLLDQALLIGFEEQSVYSLQMRTVFSLQVVEAYSPSLKQRETAVTILQRWRSLLKGGLLKSAIGGGLYIRAPKM